MSRKYLSGGWKCDTCGKFHGAEGASWANDYDFAHYELNDMLTRCAACTEKLGPIQSNAKPSDGDMSPYQGMIN